MRNLMKTLMLISVLFMAGIQNVAAQINITVTWDKELCNDTCFTQQDCEYYVCFQLWDNCGERPVLLCQDCKSVDCSMEEANFTCPDCENVSNEECYTLVGAVQKRCIGLGGTIVTCTGTGHQDYSCPYLMEYGGTVETTWN